MKCRFSIGSFFVDLAGASGTSSETQGLAVDYGVQSEQVAYIGVDESRQFFRAGSQITASFSSSTEYASVSDAELAMGAIYELLKNQDDGIAQIGSITYNGSAQVETATASGTAGTEATIIEGIYGSTIYYTTDGTDPTTSSSTIASGGTVVLPSPFTLKTFATTPGITNSPILTRNFIATGTVNEATVTPDSSAVTGNPISVVVTNELAGVTMHYTTNGTNPTTGSPTVVSGGTVSVPVPGTLKVLSVKAGLTNSPIKSASYIAKAYANVTDAPTLDVTGATSTGVMIDSGTAYRWYQFDTTGSIRVLAPGRVDYLIVGGGGAGGAMVAGYNAGGGGAGEFKHVQNFTLPLGTYDITVGAGGTGSTTTPAPESSDGRPTIFGALYTAVGGGGGGAGNNKSGRAGASGGGSTARTAGSNATGGAATAGFRGGQGSSGNLSASGGSSTAEGTVQAATTTNLAGPAGTTLNINGTSTEFAKGGGVYLTGTFPTLTKGSGGAGARTTPAAGQSGAPGVVIVRHPINYETATPSMTPVSTSVAVGNVIVTVSQSTFSRSLTIPVQSGSSASTWAGLIRTALAADSSIKARYTVSGSGTSIILTSKQNQADTSFNISLTNGTPSVGIVPAPTSANTAAGANDSVTPTITIYDAIAQVSTAYRGKSLSINATITGRTTAP